MSNVSLYQPTGLFPNSTCIDMSQQQIFSAIVNGSVTDSYELTIKDPSNNNVLYDSGNASNILNTDSNITYSGSWTTNTNQIFDDSNSSIQYFGNGWGTLNSTGGQYYNNTVHNSSIGQDYLTCQFQGTGINAYFTFGKDKGTADIYIDGNLKTTIDTYVNGTGASGNNFQTLGYSITGLPLASHTIKILVTGNKNGASIGTRIEFDYFQVLNTNGSKNSNVSGNYLQYTFTDTCIQIFADTEPSAGMVDIYIDNTKMTTVDLYSSKYNLNQNIYTNYNLSGGSHTIKLVVTGNKNAQSKDCYLYFESLTVLNKTALPSSLYDGDTLNITIPANTITQRGSLKWQLTYWNSSNNGEYVTSVEKLFMNMSVPTVTTNVTDTVTSKSFDFTGTYTQAENITVKKWNMTLYAQNYIIDEGYFGQNNGQINGTVLNEGTFDDMDNSTIRYYINEGEF